MGNPAANRMNQMSNFDSSIMPVGGLGSLGSPNTGFSGTAYGSPVSRDGSFRRSDGTVDWVVGSGPGYNWGGEDRRTGLQPVSMAPPEPDSVAERGTPQWRQAQGAREQWIEANRSQGRTLADLGLEPTRGGGLSNYMRYANTPRGSAPTGGVPAQPTMPSLQPTLLPGTGGIRGTQNPGGMGMVNNSNPFGSLNFGIPGSPNISGLFGPQGAQKRQKPMGSMGYGQRPQGMGMLSTPINNGRV